MTEAPRVFLVHHELDSALATELARALREEYGVEAWLKGWELLAGDVRVRAIEEGLQRAQGGLILVGNHPLGGWSGEEYSALLERAQAEEGQCFLIPVVCGEAAPVPPFLQTRVPLRVGDVEGIVRTICARLGLATGDKPTLGKLWRPRVPVEVVLTLRREGDMVIVSGVAGEGRAALPVAEAAGMGQQLAPRGVTRDLQALGASNAIAAVGARLGQLLAGPVGTSLAALLDPRSGRGDALVRLASDDLALLSLPWEAALVPERGPLGLIARTGVMREVAPEHPRALDDIPGPLRVLVVVAAPHDDLDTARAIEGILQAVEGARLGTARVAFIDESMATFEGLRQQLAQEAFHVVHVSAHGRPGELLFEDRDGEPVGVAPSRLAELLVGAEHRPALVLLSACSNGAATEGLGHLHAASTLVRAGVPQVIAMQGPVGDGYATELACHFYRNLARSAAPTAVRALADARQRVEQERLEHAAQGQQFIAPAPEYATPAFYGAPGVGDRPLFDGTSPGALVASLPEIIGMPGLAARPIGAIVGRRQLRRRLRKALNGTHGHAALLWGMGGAGKSSLAVSAIDGLRRDGWGLVVVVGSFSVGQLAGAVVKQLGQQHRIEGLSPAGRAAIATLKRADSDEQEQLGAIETLLANERFVLLLDNFEDNLQAVDRIPRAFVEGSRTMARLAESQRLVVPNLAAAAKRGAVLVTCRYPVEDLLDERIAVTSIEVGPLASAGVRQLVWRLEGLRGLAPNDLRDALGVLGGHPRVLEFADALLRTQPGRWSVVFPDIRGRIERLARVDGEGVLPSQQELTRAERLALATRLAAGDVLLDALLATLDAETRRFLVAVAVFRRGVPEEALQVVARAAGLSWELARCRRAMTLLADRTLLTRTEESGGRGWLVHRWTATELHRREPASAEVHGAAAQWWSKRGQTWDDHLEAVEHWLAAGAVETASGHAEGMRVAAQQRGVNLAALTLCERLVAGLVDSSQTRAHWLVNMAEHLAVLGETESAVAGLTAALSCFQGLAQREPGRADLQRDLSVSYNRLGDLHKTLGDGPTARRYFEDALAIAKALADREPARADLQRDLSISYNKLGDLHQTLGDGPTARRYFEDALALRKTLADREPARADLQRDLSISYNRLGDLHQTLGDGPTARRYFEDDLAIAKALADREPDNQQAQGDLAISYERMATVDGDRAVDWLGRAVAIRRVKRGLDPASAIVASELAISLFQLFQAVHSTDEPEAIRALTESYAILRELHARGALEAEYHALVDQLASLFDAT